MATFYPKGNGSGLIAVCGWRVRCLVRAEPPATERPVVRPGGGAQHPDPGSIERLGPDIILELDVADHESLAAAGTGIATPCVETLRRKVGTIHAQQ